MLLKEGTTCWRAEPADRAAVFIDVEDYFAAVKSSISKARRSVHVLAWAFNPKTLLDPQPDCADEEHLAAFLRDVARKRPELDVRLLVWKAALPIAATQQFYPQRAGKDFDGSTVVFKLDGKLPFGASHHQKVVVVDDAVAFCGGCDFGPDRWDTCDHCDENLRRAPTPGAEPCFDARHEVMSLVDGNAAKALGELFRDRWLRATGESLAAPTAPARGDPWPHKLPAQFRQIRVGLSRSSAAWQGLPRIRENETLYLASIAAAKSCIYLENQYFTSPLFTEALAARLAEPDGPEVVLISTRHAPSWFDHLTMDRARGTMIWRLRAADVFGRFRAYCPVTSGGETIIVHSKVTVIDDRIARVGSANLNNRSGGFDTECELGVECDDAPARLQIAAFRDRLVGHFMAQTGDAVAKARAEFGGLGPAIDALNRDGRLRPIEPPASTAVGEFVTRHHLGDPQDTQDSWRPWRRRDRLYAEAHRLTDALKEDARTVRRRLRNPSPGAGDRTPRG